MIRKLQRKLIGIVMLSLGIVIVILLGSINLFKYYNTANHADDMLRYLSENNGRFPDEKKLPSEKWDKPKPDGINEETGFKTRYFVIWLDIKGNVLRINTGHIASVSSEEAIAYGQRAVAEGKSNGYDGHYRYGVMSTADGSMVIFLDCSTELNSDRIFLLLSFAIGTVAFALVSFIAALFSRRAIRPFQEAMQKQQQFLEDAGHELKTPLAIISANNDVLELTDGKSQWTDSIRNQVSRMDSLLQSMLALTKLDMERPVLQMQSVHLSRLVSETIESFRILAQANQVVLTDSVQPGVDVTGDPASLQQLISILLENAVKYAGADGQVSIQLQLRGKTPCLWVENTCVELPSGDLNRLFDRFYRADTSRSRETGGYGIGLSIAKSICHAHHAKIWAAVTAPDSIRFTVTFTPK